MSKHRAPDLVRKLVSVCDAWIVGSACSQEKPRDYDVYIPMKYWKEACRLIPKKVKVNTLGGFKCMSDGCEVDVWTGDINDFLSSNYFKEAYHPESGIHIIRTEHKGGY